MSWHLRELNFSRPSDVAEKQLTNVLDSSQTDIESKV
jgi:hypothetical protein